MPSITPRPTKEGALRILTKIVVALPLKKVAQQAGVELKRLLPNAEIVVASCIDEVEAVKAPSGVIIAADIRRHKDDPRSMGLHGIALQRQNSEREPAIPTVLLVGYEGFSLQESMMISGLCADPRIANWTVDARERDQQEALREVIRRLTHVPIVPRRPLRPAA